MNKTLKKTLSIILTILMIVTAVPFAFAADASLVINMNDGYGDGWNGNAIQVGTISGGEFTKIADATFNNGKTATYETVISDESAYAFRWTVGSYPEECSFKILIGGETVFETSECSSYADNDYIYIRCNHSFDDSTCSKCGLECGVDFAHTAGSDGKCVVCGHTLCDDHSYTNHYCKACGYAENGYYAGACGAENVNDAIWSLDSEGTLTISGTGKYAIERYNAPWLAYNGSIKNIVIEEGITNIADTSFYELTNAVSLSIPSTVNEIDNYGNNYFAEFKLAEGNSSFTLVDGVLFNADKTELLMYPAKKAEETYTVPAGVTTLREYSFGYAENLKTINISDDVTTIGLGCFEYSSLESVNFGANVDSIEKSAFCSTSLKTVVLPEKLTEIPYALFYACQDLEKLVIGSNVTSIDREVINYCHKLDAVHFTGTEEQWEAITKPDNTTDPINTIAVHFGTFEEKTGFSATCEADGHTAGLYCAECDDYISGEVIPATRECVDENSDKICEICNKPVGAPNIYVVGIFMNGDNYTDILGDADDGATAYYIPETKTLVLDGFVYEGEGYGIECDGSLNIEIKGENKIVANYGLKFVTGNDAVINIGGTGKLDIEAIDNGIHANSVNDNDANIEINVKDSVTLNVDSADDGVDIDSNNDIKLTVSENGALNIKAVSEGIIMSGDSESVEILVKDNGALTIDGKDECIYITSTNKAAVTFTDNAKVSIKNNDEEGIYISAYESGTVTVSGNADVYIDADKEGLEAATVIVDGGSLKAYGSSGYPGILADTVTVSAGKVIAKGEDENAIYAGSIKITDGTLIASNNTTDYPVFSVTPDFSEYTSDHTILASENADGSGLAEYDSEKAENYRVITIQCKHELDGKVCKKCGFECGVDCAHYLEGWNCSICESHVYAITHQPTAEEPYVELNDETDASYQWYTVKDNTTEITDENASTVSYDWGESSYDEETGWTGVPYEEGYYGQDFFTVALEAGETVAIEVTGDFADGVGLYDYDTEENIRAYYIEGVTSYELTVEKDGNYTFNTNVYSGVVTVKATVTKTTYTKVEGQTAATLFPAELGTYACEVTFADGTKEMSEAFEATTVHTCDFSGEWKNDAEKHWKECDCGDTAEESTHSWNFGKCTVCEYACKHSFTKYAETEAPKCGVAGKEVAGCNNGCGTMNEREIPALEHKDDNGDYKCDHGCGHEFEKPAEPDEPDVPTDGNCDHLCHKDGILGFFWKIISFLHRLFGIKQYCDCGALHYEKAIFG